MPTALAENNPNIYNERPETLAQIPGPYNEKLQNMPLNIPQNMPMNIPQNMPQIPVPYNQKPQAVAAARTQDMSPPFTPDMTLAPGHEMYSFPHNLPGALELIEKAVEAENEDRLFYQYLINNAPTEEEKEIIRGIRENEITHFGLFRQIYSQLTGRMLPVAEDVPVEAPSSYCEGIKKALTGEQNAVDKYRRILFAMQNRVHINMMTEIITDEIRHGILYNYIYSKNGCKA
jgi:rubrerythrin